MKKIFSLILSATMLLSLASCANSGGSGSTPATSAKETGSEAVAVMEAKFFAEDSLRDKSDDELRAMMKDF